MGKIKSGNSSFLLRFSVNLLDIKTMIGVFIAFTFSFLLFLSPNIKAEETKQTKPNYSVLLLIAEQNVSGDIYYWWGYSSKEVNLSVVEPVIYNGLIKAGYQVIDHSDQLKVAKPYRVSGIGEKDAVSIGKNYGADLVVLGKALASAGGKVPGSTNMINSSATITGKVIDTHTNRVIAYVSGSGDSVHVNPVAAGTEALQQAAQEFTDNLINSLSSLKSQNKEGGAK
jgi:hypothetical protein